MAFDEEPMTVENVERAWKAYKDSRTRIRKDVKERYQNQIEADVEQETEAHRDGIRGLVQAALDAGISEDEIRRGVPTYATDWADFREVVGLGRAKPGRRPEGVKHGKVSTYNSGCRCDECREAVREYQKKRTARLREEGELL